MDTPGWKRFLWMLALATALPIRAEAAEPGAQQILDCMRANVPPSLRIQDVELAATDRGGGVRTLKGRLFAINDKGLIRAMLRINAPTDLSGAAYLVRGTPEGRNDEMFMFLPAINRVRRISGGTADGSLLGTDFSYNDLRQLQTAFNGSEPSLEKPTQIEGRPVHVLSLRIPAGEGTRYSAMRAWVDEKTCVALKLEFFEGETPRKRFTAPAAALQQTGKYWYAAQAQMSDLKDHTSTVLKVVGVSGGDALASRYFDPHSFYLGN